MSDNITNKSLESDSKDENRLYCPIDGCVYCENGTKFFKKKMLLNHHIANVHSEKKFVCEKCGKQYAMDWQLKYHHKSCGIEWKCDTCNKSYDKRLSLITHCKRHAHQLPSNAVVKSKTTHITNVIVMPILVQNVMPLQANVGSPQRQIRPKLSDNQIDESFTMCSNSVRTNSSGSNVCNCNDCEEPKSDTKSNPPKVTTIATQTEHVSNRHLKQRESRSAQCPPIIKRNRKTVVVNCESIETQTLESALHSNTREKCQKRSASTSTSPPKRSRKRPVANATTITNAKRSCVFTQTITRVCDSETSTDDSQNVLTKTDDSQNVLTNNPFFNQTVNPQNLMSTEQSVQTQTIDDDHCEFYEPFNDIQTQTVNIDIDEVHLLHFDTELFTDLELTDIETQTIWKSDGTTQTDEYLDEIDDVIKKYFSDECTDVPTETFFADTETQTNIDLSKLTYTCSYAQT